MQRSILAAAVAVLAAAAIAAQAPTKKVLYLTHSAGYKHEVVPLSMQLLPEIGKKNGFDVVATRDLTFLSPQSLKSYDAVVFYTTGELPIGDADKANLLAWVKSGKGFAGIHSATDTFYQWPEYGEMIGGYFDNHPWHEEVTAKIEDAKSPADAAFRGPDVDPDRRDLSVQELGSLEASRAAVARHDVGGLEGQGRQAHRRRLRARLDQHDGQRPRLLHGARPPPRGVAVARVPGPPGRRHQVDPRPRTVDFTIADTYANHRDTENTETHRG